MGEVQVWKRETLRKKRREGEGEREQAICKRETGGKELRNCEKVASVKFNRKRKKDEMQRTLGTWQRCNPDMLSLSHLSRGLPYSGADF